MMETKDVTVEVETLDADTLLTDEERQPCEVWTRVMGYHRPVDSFNDGKKSEHAERVPYASPEE